MKHHAQTSADGFTLEHRLSMHPLWSQVIEHVSQRYQEAFFAELKQFMPAYLTLIEGGQIVSVCGFRIAEDEPLFLNSI